MEAFPDRLSTQLPCSREAQLVVELRQGSDRTVRDRPHLLVVARREAAAPRCTEDASMCPEAVIAEAVRRLEDLVEDRERLLRPPRLDEQPGELELHARAFARIGNAELEAAREV